MSTEATANKQIKQSEARPDLTLDAITTDDIATMSIFEQFLALVRSYLDTLKKNYQKMAAQDRKNEKAVQAKKGATKGYAQAAMESIDSTTKGRATGNSSAPTGASPNTSSSGSEGSTSSGAAMGTGPSYA